MRNCTCGNSLWKAGSTFGSEKLHRKGGMPTYHEWRPSDQRPQLSDCDGRRKFGCGRLAGYHLNKKKKSNKSGYPDEAIKTLARCFYPSMVEFFNSEEGQREYEEWLKEQEVLQALPVAA